MAIKIENSNLTLKVGSTEVTAAYLGSTLVYSGGTPTFNGKWLATYSGGSTSSAECDSSSAITMGEITLENLVSVQIGDCVTSIGDRAFQACTSLTSINIPNSVTTIDPESFFSCFRLTSIDIPDSVSAIWNSTFQDCYSLSSCTIGSGVRYIADSAFNNCISLTSITIKATTPPEAEGNFFDNTNDCPIYVPSGSVSAYQSASGWSEYADRIQAIP